MIAKNFYYSLIVLILLSSCASSNIDKILKQGNVVQENFKTTIPFTYVNDWIVLEVEIKNKPYNFILDTGHSNLLTKELAAELNSEVLGTEAISDVNNTENSIQYTKIENVKIGDIDFENTIASIVDLNENIEVGCTKISGIIGSNLMRKAVWDFDFHNQLITISNDENNLDIPAETIESRMYIGTAGIPSITLQINGKKVLNNMVDFGNRGTNLMRSDYFQEQLDAHLIKKYVNGNQKAWGAFGHSEEQQFYYAIIEELQMGNHTVNKLFARVKSGAGNNVGLEFFKNYRVILNWNKKKIKMVEVAKAGNDAYISYGFSKLYKEGGLFVNSVVETSSASEFLKNGDKILRVNDTDYANITEEQYCNIMNDDFDNETAPLSITILRNEKELTFELTKTVLL